MKFEEFWLDLTSVDDDEVRVSLHDSPSGEASPFNARLPAIEDVERLAAAFEQVRGHRDWVLPAPPVASLEERLAELGGQLSDALFKRHVRDRWMASCGRGMRPDGPLRLRLQMSITGRGGARLHATPWECLCTPDGDVAALDLAFSLVRHVVGPGRDAAPPPRPRPLVVLVVAAQAPPMPPLDLDAETAALRRLQGDELRVEVLDEPSLESLRRRLAAGPVHVLHFLGHGGFDPVEERGVVFLPRRRGGAAVAVTGAQLANVLQAACGLRLVFLNACRTAAAAAGSPFAGVATALIRKAGVPAVLAMQYPIPDRAAILFAGEVYGRLAAGEGIDRAVTEGRRQLYHEQQAAWVVPVLFSRQRGELFAAPAPAPVRVPQPRPRRLWWLRVGAVLVLAAALVGAAVVGRPWFSGTRSDLREAGALGLTDQPVDPGDVEIDEPPSGPPGGAEEGPAVDENREPAPTEPATDLPTGTAKSALRTQPVEPEPEPPGARTVADGSKQLTCGQVIHFAGADAYVGCSRDTMGSEAFLSLSLRMRGKTYPRRAVLGSADVEFPGPPDAVVAVADVDLEAGRLTVFPPSLSQP